MVSFRSGVLATCLILGMLSLPAVSGQARYPLCATVDPMNGHVPLPQAAAHLAVSGARVRKGLLSSMSAVDREVMDGATRMDLALQHFHLAGDGTRPSLQKEAKPAVSVVPPLVARRLFCLSNGEAGKVYHQEELEAMSPAFHQMPENARTGDRISKTIPAGRRIRIPKFLSATEVEAMRRWSTKDSEQHKRWKDMTVPSELAIPFVARLRAMQAQLNISEPLHFETSKIRAGKHQFIPHTDNSAFDIMHGLRIPLPHALFRTWTLDIAMEPMDSYEGGGLTFMHPEATTHRHDVGDAILFESGVTNAHKVQRTTTGQRRMFIIWMHSEPFSEESVLGRLYTSIAERDAMARDVGTAVMRSDLFRGLEPILTARLGGGDL